MKVITVSSKDNKIIFDIAEKLVNECGVRTRFPADMKDWRIKLDLMLVEFGDIFRVSDGLQAMMDYIVWALAHEEPNQHILDTVMHDLLGRREPFMAPRTGSYLGINDKKDGEE